MKIKKIPLYLLLLTLCFAVVAASAAYSAQVPQNMRIAVFPFENFSEEKNAPANVMRLVAQKMRNRGFELLDEENLNAFLLKERVRCTGYVSLELARKLKEELRVDAILMGSVNAFSNAGNPHVGLSARLVRASDFRIVWANHAAATGEDSVGLLGLGKIEDVERLAREVVDELLGSFSVIPPDKESESVYRIAVMPFQNRSKVRNAGKAATYMFIVKLFKSERFEPFEFGEIRHLIVDLRVRDKGEIDYERTGAISKSAGVDGIILGTVEEYSAGTGPNPPEAAISARLLDARNERLLWSDSVRRTGDDSILMLDWGRIRSADSVTDEIMSKIVGNMEKVRW